MTFTPDEYAARITRAEQAAVEAGLAGLLITPGPDLTYFTGYRPHVTERLTMLMIGAEREPALIVPALERGDAERAPVGERLSIVDWSDGADPYQAAARLLPAEGRYGISDSAWSMHLLGLQEASPRLRFGALTYTLPMLRAVKDATELHRMAAAGAAADAAYEEIVNVRFAGRREVDIAADLAELLIGYGHSQVDFTVVGSGPNGANPHHGAGDRVIGDGDTIVLDFGGLMDGYGSDTTRTVQVGRAQDEVAEVHEIVQRAQQAAFEAVRPGVTCEDIDRTARRVIAEAGYGDYFIHRTGHGIGVTTHEPPYLVEGERQPLVPGMCFSIEPGIYLPGRFGVRIEDIVTCTEDVGRRFNNTSRALRPVG
jgi:Xaa-Pro aminopeptidase